MTRVSGGHGPVRHFEAPVSGNTFSDLAGSMAALVEQYNTLVQATDVHKVRHAALEMDQYMNCVRPDLSVVLVALAAYPARSQRRAAADRDESQPQTTASGEKAVPDE